MRHLSLAWLLGTATLVAGSAGAQDATARLTLGDALDRGDARAYANRAQGAMASAQRAQALAPLKGVLPSVRFDAGFVRTTDPIGAFGTTLRQRTITQQDFDPRRLNYPAAVNNYTGAMVLEQPLFNADALVGRRAASRAGDAARATADWTTVGTRVDVIRAYYGAVLAREKVVTLEAALRAAKAHVKQADDMAKNGVVTPSDALLASVKAGEVETMLIEASGEALNARLGLATLLGTPADTAWQLPGGLPASDALRSLGAEALDATVRGMRADVDAARASADAADADALRARSLYLPRINGFARYDWNSALRPYGGDNNWTVGVVASWSPFAGASELGEVRATAGRRDAATAMREGAEAKARLEVEQSATALRTALARLEIAERGVKQAMDAHRIVGRKYAGGLAPVVELLDAAAIETQARMAHAGARYTLLVATAERRRALGLDPGALRALDAAPQVALNDR
ncbi:MAG TPA: TolC family protein [Gemmatimonadaceae bacterium]|nr:TolC family protein [Gemmatimonadaceae bacterium]